MRNETKLCKYCQTEIPMKAKVCPNCRRKLNGGILKYVLIAIFALFAIGVIFGDNEKDEPKKVNEVSNTGENQVRGEDNENEVKNQFTVGDVVETKDLRISFISAEDYVSDNQFIQPKDGNKYIEFEFEFENISNSDKVVSSFNFNCYADGYKADQSWIGDDDGLDATLSKGKKTKGTIFFEIPINTQEITLEYETNFWTEKKVVFIIKREG